VFTARYELDLYTHNSGYFSSSRRYNTIKAYTKDTRKTTKNVAVACCRQS